MKEETRRLLVDGYNVIHATDDLRAKLRREGPEAAREALLQELRILHDFDGYRLDLVFDGQGSELTATAPTGEPTLRCLFAPGGLTADGVISQLVQNAPDGGVFTVATADRVVQQLVGAHGASVVSPAGLFDMVESATRRQLATLKARRQQSEDEWKRGV